MKRFALLSTLLAVFVLAFQGCRGPEGLPGPQGPEGPAGPETLPMVFNVTANFNAAGGFRASVNMPNNLEVYDTDIVLVYLAYDVATVGGAQTTVWRLLPQVFPVENGFFQYNYDFTEFDVEFFMDGNIDLSTLDNSWTQNQLFRVAVLPAEALARKAAVDFADYEAVSKAYGLEKVKVDHLTAN
jgi:hypothetical protein